MRGWGRPAASFEHEPHIPPERFRAWLRAQGFPVELIRTDAGDAVPAEPRHFSGQCFMGGTMSVNDDPRAGAPCFLVNDFCSRPAYVIQRDGFAHLGMQIHIEMTPERVLDGNRRAIRLRSNSIC